MYCYSEFYEYLNSTERNDLQKPDPLYQFERFPKIEDWKVEKTTKQSRKGKASGLITRCWRFHL